MFLKNRQRNSRACGVPWEGDGCLIEEKDAHEEYPSFFDVWQKGARMAKYWGKGAMLPGAIEEDVVDSRWKTWSIGCDVHVKTVCAAVWIPDYSIGKIQRFVVKYEMNHSSLQAMKTWLLDLKKTLGIRSVWLKRPRPIIARLSTSFMENVPRSWFIPLWLAVPGKKRIHMTSRYWRIMGEPASGSRPISPLGCTMIWQWWVVSC